MCISIPGCVVAIRENEAEIDVLGAPRTASTLMRPEVQVGDYVLTSAGMIVEILDAADAETSIALFRELMMLEMPQDNMPENYEEESL
jgi:hydrogenase assembly chaperone HypC/HupF